MAEARGAPPTRHCRDVVPGDQGDRRVLTMDPLAQKFRPITLRTAGSMSHGRCQLAALPGCIRGGRFGPLDPGRSSILRLQRSSDTLIPC